VSFEHVRLGALADVIVSNVDKHSVEGQPPVRLCNYTDVYYEHKLDQSRQYMTATASPDQIKKFRLQVDDVIITKDSETADDIGIPALVTETADDFVCGYHLAILRPNPQKADGRYLNWTLQSGDLQAQFENIAFGVTRVGLKTGRIKTLEIPIPGGPVEQARIADYLDRETATIDALIEKQRSLLTALGHRKRLVVEADLEPAHAMTVPLRRLVDATVGVVVTPSKWYAETGVVALRGTNIRHGYLDLSDIVHFSIEGNAIHPKSRLDEGDVVIVRTGDTGRAAVIPAQLRGAQAIDVLVVRPGPELNPEFLVHLMGSRLMDQQIELSTQGTIQGHLNVSALKDVTVPVPSYNEQIRLVERWDRETAKIDALIAKAERFIELAQERRAALITAAVTGQIEIPTED